MSRRTTQLVKAALSAIHYSGASRVARPLTSGRGVIFMLHHVRPEPPGDFEPNRILKITPEFLDTAIRHVKDAGFDTIALDDVPARLADPMPRPFACFTFDDGYRDNRDHALPVFRRHGVPLTIYVPSAFADGTGDLWWLTLEAAIARLDQVRVVIAGELRCFPAATADQKLAAFHAVYWWLRSLPEVTARAIVAGIAGSAGYDPSDLCRSLVMSWDELRDLARDPLVTIGAHTRGHFALAKLSEEEARAEMAESIERVERELGRPCRHFSYPYGDEGSAGAREFRLARELGLATAVTTRKGLLHARHAGEPVALPRLSLNGDYQDERFLSVLLSGVPFALRDVVRRIASPTA
jgi:peptidoglycan/xylan/chitin deacetylase (PgdA/CDA1 family)